MRAAKNFSWGPEGGEATDRRSFKVGEEIPKKIADDIPDELILEKVAKNDPSKLSREQLLVMAGVKEADELQEAGEEEINEEELREALGELRTKGDVVDWAKETLGVDLDADDTRSDLEDQVVEFYFGEEEETEEEEEDEEDNE